MAVTAHAQSNGIPAEFPPAGFDGNQFVDSEGCAFIKAGISGVVTWVPRVDRARNQLCHFQPTFVVAAEEIELDVLPEVMAEVEAIETVGEPETAALTIETPMVSEVAPMRVAASMPVRAPIATAPIERAMGTAVAAPEIPRMTLAQVCSAIESTGRTYIDAATGQPVQCNVTTANAAPAFKIPLFGQPEIPASNPTTSVRNVPNPPAGYRRVWNDGRLNTQRGIPAAKSQ